MATNGKFIIETFQWSCSEKRKAVSFVDWSGLLLIVVFSLKIEPARATNTRMESYNFLPEIISSARVENCLQMLYENAQENSSNEKKTVVFFIEKKRDLFWKHLEENKGKKIAITWDWK